MNTDMKTLLKKIWATYCEGVYLTYYPYYKSKLDV